ncbi:MAG: Gfo/Idh/MocA family oxidoreductase [Burkholderiales bacterium]|nr:Gfo/Idh/MocA family oxidoreductase [Burkholderiales bacterium]
MRRIRWGVLGTADIAKTRALPAMAGAPSATLAAIGSRDLARARAMADAFGAPRAHGSYEALLADPEVDALYVPLPNHLHLEWSVRALEAGKHVLCEKPLVLRSAEIAVLAAARERTGRHIEEAFSYRNHPQWAKIRELVDLGAIGEPLAVHATLAKQFHDPDDIRNNPDKGGGALYDLGSYTISACTQVYGRAPQRVIGALDRDPRYTIDRLSTAILDYGGRHATLSVSSQGGPNAWASHQQFTVLGSRGWLACDFPYAHGRPTACHVFVGDEASAGSMPTRTWTFEPVNQYALQFERFSRKLLGDDVPSWPVEDAATTLRIIEAIFASARDGLWKSP